MKIRGKKDLRNHFGSIFESVTADGAVSAVMWTLYQPVVMKRELSVKAKLSKKNETGDISGRVYSER